MVIYQVYSERVKSLYIWLIFKSIGSPTKIAEFSKNVVAIRWAKTVTKKWKTWANLKRGYNIVPMKKEAGVYICVYDVYVNFIVNYSNCRHYFFL